MRGEHGVNVRNSVEGGEYDGASESDPGQVRFTVPTLERTPLISLGLAIGDAGALLPGEREHDV